MKKLESYIYLFYNISFPMHCPFIYRYIQRVKRGRLQHVPSTLTFEISFWNKQKQLFYSTVGLTSLPLEMFNSFGIFMTVSMTTALFLMTRSTLTLALTSEMYGPSTRNTLADFAEQHGKDGQLCCSELQQPEITID